MENVNIRPVIMLGSPNLHTWWSGSTEVSLPHWRSHDGMQCRELSPACPTLSSHSLDQPWLLSVAPSLGFLIAHTVLQSAACLLSWLCPCLWPRTYNTRPHQFSLGVYSPPTGQHGWSNLEFILLLFLALKLNVEVERWKITLNNLLNSLKIWL